MRLLPRFVSNKIQHRPVLFKIINNISWLYLDKAIRMIILAMVGFWFARYIGPEKFGVLNYATALVGMFGSITMLGLKPIAVRDIALMPDNSCAILGTVALLQFIAGLISCIAINCMIGLLRPDEPMVRMAVAILSATLMLKPFEIGTIWFESQVQSKYIVVIQNILLIVFAATKTLLILIKTEFMSFIWLMLFESLAMTLGLIYITEKKSSIRFAKLSVRMDVATKLIMHCWPIILSEVVASVYMKIDQIMLGKMLGNEAVGVYSAASKLTEIWYIVPAVIVASCAPTLVVLKNTDTGQFKLYMQKLYGILVKTGLIVSIITVLFSNQIIETVYGTQYSESAEILTWNIWCLIFVCFGVAWTQWLIIEGYQNVALLMHIMSLALNILLNYLLIPKFGVIGAAIGTTISYAAGHTIFILIFPSQKIAVRMFWRAFI